ncbi:MAG: iron hydrogenase small subunit [Eubacterium sp.]|nr:iron hydrogenase small subunit [Eubacterium sp.]
MSKITINVDTLDIQVSDGLTILEAIREVNYDQLDMSIPTLYYLKGVKEVDESGVCVAEVEGEAELVNASVYKVYEGMKVQTKSPKCTEARKAVLADIAAKHDKDCINCHRPGTCELQELLHKYEISSSKMDADKKVAIDDRAIIVRDHNKCIRCGRCVAVCKNGQGVEAIKATGEGWDMVVEPVSADGLIASGCVNCGQCIIACPVGALYAKDATAQVFDAIADPNKYVMVEVAPAVRASLGEEFDFNIGTDVEKRLPETLRALGFDKVFDTKFSADLTIMEEANEFIERLNGNGPLPIMTSCCPAWVKHCEDKHPELLANMSSCKSPQQMFGATAKSYYAEKMGIAKEDIVMVSVMPCSAKKFEITRDDQDGAGVPDVDIAITAREFARMIKEAEVKLTAVPFEPFDDPLGIGTGAGVIFGVTGGVMEAALRTAVEKLTGETLPKLEFCDVRGMEGIKEASYDIAGTTVKVAVASGLANADALLEKVKAGEADYHIIEVMSCPGGCINGGGQPHQLAATWDMVDVRGKRAAVLYKNDANSPIRKSHENPAIIELYDTYLGAPGSEKAHQLLHTTYVAR